jgi:hypothetical protein
MLTAARRRVVLVLHWISLPLAAVCVGGPLWSVASEYHRYDGKQLTEATVLSERVSIPRSRGTQAGYDVEVRYQFGRQEKTDSLLVMSYRLLKPGDKVNVYVDPKTGAATSDDRTLDWEMVAWGGLAAVFFLLVGFRYSGRALATDS